MIRGRVPGKDENISDLMSPAADGKGVKALIAWAVPEKIIYCPHEEKKKGRGGSFHMPGRGCSCEEETFSGGGRGLYSVSRYFFTGEGPVP